MYPAYYEVALKYQKTRDQETVEMLDIIFTSRGCDIGMIYSWGKLDDVLHKLQSADKNAFTSTYESLKDVAQAQLEATIEFYKEFQ